MVVVAVIVMTMIIVAVVVMGGRGVRVRTMPVVMMLDRIAARIARMRPDDRDQAGDNSAQQRQKDDCLNHLPLPFAHDPGTNEGVCPEKPASTFPDHAP